MKFEVKFVAQFGTAVDCGPLELDGMKADLLPSTTTFGNHFVFACEPGFVIIGTNGRDDKVVTCTKTGRWNIGGLRCEGGWQTRDIT